jgi:hypothetical protein
MHLEKPVMIHKKAMPASKAIIGSTKLTASAAGDAGFWRELSPELTIEGHAAAPLAKLPDAASVLRILRDEGYINTRDVFDPTDIARLCEGVRRLHTCGIPPVFAFAYDEYWQIFRSLKPFLSNVLGGDYRMLPDLWAWFVPPSNQAAGWVPHRDRAVPTLQPDNTPNSLTVWIPLTDATPLNGCMYVLPARFDPDLHTPSVSAKNEFFFAGENVQNIRALPATAGSLLAWNQSLVHWGSRASDLGAEPRCSIALQFQRGDIPPLESALRNPHTLPSLHERIGLIGRLITVFSGFLAFPPEVRLLARALEWKYWRRSEV